MELPSLQQGHSNEGSEQEAEEQMLPKSPGCILLRTILPKEMFWSKLLQIGIST